MSPLIGLSSSSVYPETTAAAFEIASSLGYDGVEVMVGTDSISQDVDALAALVDHYQLPVLSIHAPCLLVTQRVWGTDSWAKLRRAQAAAELLGAPTVVVHPPFRWQREYARTFVGGLEAMRSETAVQFAVENMFPWRAVSQGCQPIHRAGISATRITRTPPLIFRIPPFPEAMRCNSLAILVIDSAIFI